MFFKYFTKEYFYLLFLFFGIQLYTYGKVGQIYALNFFLFNMTHIKNKQVPLVFPRNLKIYETIIILSNNFSH